MAKNAVRGAENCRLEQAERNRYFFGKLLTARDFELEQGYHIEKVRSIHRFIHGVGVVCGLQVEKPELADNKLSVLLHPGVGYDCCGRQIVVSRQDFVTVQEKAALEGEGYLYLRYVEVEKEPVPTLPNSGSDEQDCRPSRTQERFELIFSDESPPAKDAAFVFSSEKEDLEARNIELAGKYYRERLGHCPECSDPKVFLAVVHISESGNAQIDQEKTDRYRQLVFSNRMLRDLVLGHLQNFANPHNTTAEQVGALVSINGVENPGGGVGLISSNRSITIEPRPSDKAIDLRARIGSGGQARIFTGEVDVRFDRWGHVEPVEVTVEELEAGEQFAVVLAPRLDPEGKPPRRGAPQGNHFVYGGLSMGSIFNLDDRTLVAYVPSYPDPDRPGGLRYDRKFHIRGFSKKIREKRIRVFFWVIGGLQVQAQSRPLPELHRRDSVLGYVRENPGKKPNEIEAALKIEMKELQALLTQLVDEGLIKKDSQNRYRMVSS